MNFDYEYTPVKFNNITSVIALFTIAICLVFIALDADITKSKAEVTETTTNESTVYDTTVDNINTEFVTDNNIVPPLFVPDYNASPDITIEETTFVDNTITEDTTAEDTTIEDTTAPETEAAYVVLDETEKLIFATLVAYECGGASYETKCAVASVIVNRMKIWDDSLRDVVFATNQFSPAELINKKTGANQYWHNGKKCTKNMERGGPYEECWLAVEEVCSNGPSIPTYVLYFRSGRYHNWSTLVNYAKIGPMYFSYAPKHTKVCPDCDERFTKKEYTTHSCN